MKSIAIIGAGRLGTSLGYTLSRKGYSIKALSCRTLVSAEESRQKIAQGSASTDNVRTAGQAEVLFLTVPDDGIKGVVEELASSPLTWKEKIVFQCSGLLTSRVLDPLRSKGAYTASFHPCFSFPEKQSHQDLFLGVHFALEGDVLAVAAAKDIIASIGGLSFMIAPEYKACYHTACSLASNMSVALFYTAISLLGRCGLGEDEAKKVLGPLLERTLQNVNKIDILDALTGPVARGDLTTIKKHLCELEKFPPVRRIYIALAIQALEMVKRRDIIPKEKIRAMAALLGCE